MRRASRQLILDGKTHVLDNGAAVVARPREDVQGNRLTKGLATGNDIGRQARRGLLAQLAVDRSQRARAGRTGVGEEVLRRQRHRRVEDDGVVIGQTLPAPRRQLKAVQLAGKRDEFRRARGRGFVRCDAKIGERPAGNGR